MRIRLDVYVWADNAGGRKSLMRLEVEYHVMCLGRSDDTSSALHLSLATFQYLKRSFVFTL